MIDVYSIGTTVKLTDLVTPQLLKLAEGFTKVDAIALQVNKRLRSMGAEVGALRRLSVVTGSIDSKLRSVTGNAIKAGKALGDIKASVPPGALGIEKELIEANRQVNILGRQISSLRGAGHGFLGTGGFGGGGGGRGGTPALPSPGGGGRRRGHLHGGNVHVGSHGLGISGVGMGLADGLMIPAAAAMGAAYVGHAFYESAKGYQDAFMRFRSLNLGAQTNVAADSFVKNSNTFGVSHTELMSALGEGVGLFGSFDEARKYMPMITQLGKANSAIFGGKTGDLDDAGLKSLLKFIDRRGGFKDEATFGRQLDLAEKMVTGSSGFLKFQDLANFSQNAGTAFRGLSDEGLLHMEGLMIEQGGQKSGTALMSLYQNLVAGRMPKKAMGMLQDLGLATLQEQTHGSVGGKPLKSLVMTGIQGSDLLQADPAKWMTDVLVPALTAHHITGDQDVLKAVNDILSNRTASNQGSLMTVQQWQLIRDQNIARGAMGASDVSNMYKNSASGAENDFDAAWTDFKAQFGKTMLPAITSMLQTGSAILRTINAWAANPMTAAQAQIDQVPQADHKAVGRWGSIGDFFGWNGPASNPHASSSVVGASSSASGNVHTTVNIDGRKVAQAVTPYIAGQLGSGTYAFGVDPTVALPMPGIKG
jgi:hypothetical protein